MAERFDAVIVGAGAAGCLYAARLAEAGKSVLVLEAGPAWGLEHLVSNQIWARRLKWGADPVMSKAPSGHAISFGWGFGGAALHHYGTWPRPTADTFKLNSLYGRGLDWPVEYDELRPYYDRIQEEIGISGDAAAEPWRPPGQPYPMPPMKTFRHGELLRGGFERLGLPVAPLPAAINTVWYKDRAPCLYDGWCDAGCPIGSLANPLVTQFITAQDRGADFRARATVTRVLTRRRRATGVIYRDGKGAEHTVQAAVVILAASVVQTPRLLLASANDDHPEGVANSSGLVGRYFMIEPGAHVFGLFGEPTQVHLGVSAGQLMHRQAHKGAKPRPDGAYQWQIAPSMKPNDIFGVAFTRPDLRGGAFDAFIKDGCRSMASLAGFGADEPAADNRITLAAQKDANGMPLAQLNHTVSPATQALWKHMVDEGVAVMKAAGAREAWHAPLAPGHVSGGTIMGADPKTSVTDSFGRAHDLDNLILSGAGLFPTNGGTSPTFTVYAVAARSAERLTQRWDEYAAA
jgi:choline dehydrogenase-like flavoprotein